jgi:hypothetical protein
VSRGFVAGPAVPPAPVEGEAPVSREAPELSVLALSDLASPRSLAAPAVELDMPVDLPVSASWLPAGATDFGVPVRLPEEVADELLPLMLPEDPLWANTGAEKAKTVAIIRYVRLCMTAP